MQTDSDTAIERSQRIIDAILMHIDSCNHENAECCAKLILKDAFEN